MSILPPVIRPLAARPGPSPRFSPSDPLYGDQWHLAALGDLETIWNDYTGAGVVIGVYDDGIQYDHPDLDDNVDTGAELVIGGVTIPGDPQDNIQDVHGTSVAGIIAAEANGDDVVGIAHGATLVGVNIFSQEGFDYEPEVMNSISSFDITNNSWGYNPQYFINFNTDPYYMQFETGLMDAVDNGRGGLGTIIVKAAGNEWDGYTNYLNQFGDRGDVNASNINNSRTTIAVSAIDDTGTVSFYSNRGAALLVGAPSDGDFHFNDGITTTDRTGSEGYSNGDTTDAFGGTSAATPMVSGTVALMLEANPDLGWRDVQSILAIAARHTGSTPGAAPTGNEAFGWSINGAATWNGGGYHFSNDYGYGLVDAYAATRIAEAWTLFSTAQTSANEQTASDAAVLGQRIKYGADVSFDFSISGSFTMEYAELTLDFRHRQFSDLTILLTSPDGTVSELQTAGAAGIDDTADDGIIWTYGSNAIRGELSDGTWNVTIIDSVDQSRSSGRLYEASLNLYGATEGQDDVYHYTDEVFTALGWDALRMNVNDSDGGDDWIDAAAMTGDLAIDLDAGTGFVGTDQFLSTTGGAIENIVAGDGGDTLDGNGANNQLYGGYGRDLISGGDGDDQILGGDDRDTLSGGDGDDFLDGWWGTDRLLGGRGQDTLISGAHGDLLSGNGQNDELYGGGGSDRVFGGNGADTLDGGPNPDKIYGGRGGDILIGGTGADRFYFDSNDGVDTITDFEDGSDLIILQSIPGITGFGDLAISSVGNDVHVDYLTGTIILQDTAIGQIDATDFNFV